MTYDTSKRTGALVVIAALLLVGAAFVAPPLFVSERGLSAVERLKAENDLRSTLLQTLAGLFLAAGLYFTARTFDLNREGHITERFTRAVDQLGNEARNVRVGAIWALRRVALDSRADVGPIIEILTSFVHEQSPWPPKRGQTGAPADAQAAVEVLAHLADEIENPLGGRLALRLANLDLRRAKLDLVDLREADLRGTHFDGASLIRAKFGRTRLQRASFADVRMMTSASFTDARYSKRSTKWPAGFDPENAGAFNAPDTEDLEAERDERRAAKRPASAAAAADRLRG